MSRYIGPKNKRARAVGEDLNLKRNGLKLARRLSVRPGQHGVKGRRKMSDFGTQQREKQKVRFMYGIGERQLRAIYQEASKSLTATGSTMLTLLERRLDNVVYRLGYAPTRAAARQMVGHCHVMVNQKTMSIPSYRVKRDDVITLAAKATNIPVVKEMLADLSAAPAWFERKQAVAKVVRFPLRSDLQEPIAEQLVVEFYSR